MRGVGWHGAEGRSRDARVTRTGRRAVRGKKRAARPRGYHHGDLPRALIDSAVALIAEDGIAALTLRGVARRAGVSHAAPVHHFRDLDGLHRAIAAEGFALLTAHQRKAAAEPGDANALERFRALGIAYIEFAAGHRAYFRAMFHPRVADRSMDPTLAASAGGAFDLLLAGVRAAQADGFLSDADPRDLAMAAWAMTHGAAELLVDGHLDHKGFGTVDVRGLATEVTGRLFLGLRP